MPTLPFSVPGAVNAPSNGGTSNILQSILSYLSSGQSANNEPDLQNLQLDSTSTLGGSDVGMPFSRPMQDRPVLGQHNTIPRAYSWLEDRALEFQPGTGMARTGWLSLRLTQKQIDEIVRLRNVSRESYRTIANRFNIDPSSVMNILKRENAHIPVRPAYNTRLSSNLDEIAERRAQGDTYSNIASDFNTDGRAIRNILRRHNRDSVREPQFLDPVSSRAIGRVDDPEVMQQAESIKNLENSLRQVNTPIQEITRQLNQRFKLGTTVDEVENRGGWWWNPSAGYE